MFGKEGGGLAAGPKQYLFSGLLKCGVCGGSIALVCGRGRHGADRHGCSLHHQRGDSVPRMLNRFRKAMEGRNLPAELAAFKDALQLKYNAAQRLFNGGDE
jgi:hypothetical protein